MKKSIVLIYRWPSQPWGRDVLLVCEERLKRKTCDINLINYLQITADTNKACTGDFGASSAAAAMASGLIALMLSAK